jgi:hypothetical protein
VKKLLFVIALLSASSAFAQAAPYKFVILWGSNGVAITDYPSLARCNEALASLEKRKAREDLARTPKNMPGGGMIVSPQWQMEFFCLPG